MKKETYLKIFHVVGQLPLGTTGIQIIDKTLTYAAALIYFAAVLGILFAKKWISAAALLLVPAISFSMISLFRSVYNAERPYEVYDFEPLINKDTKGKSFPSRHVFSIFVIGSSLFWFYPYAGVIVCFMGCGLAVIRVAGGVHFPKDVIGGAVAGIVCGCLVGIFI